MIQFPLGCSNTLIYVSARDDYSCLPNCRAGLIKRAGWNFSEKKLREQDQISKQGGTF